METLLKDIRYGIRSLLKRPGFTSITVITLALGIGANTAIFSVVNAVLLRPLPFAEAEVKYPTEKQAQFYHDLVARVESLPGVRSASAVIPLPLSGDAFSISFETEGRPMAKGNQPSADFFAIGDGYFKTLGVSVLQGRDFNGRDNKKAPGVVIVNQAFARKFFPNEDPIGKRIKPGISTLETDPAMREIVGVVSDVRNRNLSSELRPGYFVPAAQIPFNQMTMVVRTTNDPHSLITAVQNEVHAMDRELPVFNVKTMDEYISATVAAPRFNATLLVIFSAVALVLTIVGLYGVMSYSVAQRTNEIGIRMALGAQTRDVMRLIVSQGFKLVLVGLAIGLAGAFALMRVIASLLFGVTTKDPLTFAAVAVLLAVVALLACYIPARRATRLDPLSALRYE